MVGVERMVHSRLQRVYLEFSLLHRTGDERLIGCLSRRLQIRVPTSLNLGVVI